MSSSVSETAVGRPAAAPADVFAGSRPNRLEHPGDVMGFVADTQERGDRCTLVVVTGTVGGAVRAPGAMMAVSEHGATAGYVSNGCVDADIVFQARQAMAAGRPRRIRYGRGSPFFDVRLPCGGAIDLLLVPDPTAQVVRNASTALADRRSIGLRLSSDGGMRLLDGSGTETGWRDDAFTARYEPKLRLRIAGGGPEILALTKLAVAAGLETVVQSPDSGTLWEAAEYGAGTVVRLTTPNAVPKASDDAGTAVVLMFHDHDWETPLLEAALAGTAFYVGALGSRRTQTLRRQALADRGVPPDRVDRVRGPIGLIPSMRDASMLAVSALAEVVAAFHARPGA